MAKFIFSLVDRPRTQNVLTEELKMEKSVLRYALDNLIQGTSLVSKHSDFTEYTREDIVSIVNYLLNDGHTLENNFKKKIGSYYSNNLQSRI